MILSFNEIKDGQQFENLVVAYFKNLNIEKLAITEIRVEPSGVGADGGRDILVHEPRICYPCFSKEHGLCNANSMNLIFLLTRLQI